MRISFIVAMAENRTIGKDNQLPWHLPDDLQHFKALTLGKPILMGRKTHVSIGRPLPNRTNIILTRDNTFTAKGCLIAHNMDEAFDFASGCEEIFVVGGAEIYALLLPKTTRIYLTHDETALAGDTFFPE